jgi:hypothetical protein
MCICDLLSVYVLNRKKMNTLELLYNKALMKAAGEADEHVKKTKL